MKKKNIVFLVLFLVFLALSAIVFFIRQDVASMAEQNAHRRWSEDRYAQLSAFWNTGTGIDYDSVLRIRYGINEALNLEGYKQNDNNSGTWYDAYSSVISCSSSTERASCNVSCVVFGGAYFRIHSIPLRYGSYLNDQVEHIDCCVLDRNAAWQLFGAIDVTGMTVLIDGHEFTVCGIVDSYSEFTGKLSSDSIPRVYILFKSGIDSVTGLPVECYEAVMPDPIKSFAKDIFSSSVGSYTKMTENSNRFSYSSLFSTLISFTGSGTRESAEVYPYWENTALKAQSEAAVLLLSECILLLISLVFFILFLRAPLSVVSLKYKKYKQNIVDKLHY